MNVITYLRNDDVYGDGCNQEKRRNEQEIGMNLKRSLGIIRRCENIGETSDPFEANDSLL